MRKLKTLFSLFMILCFLATPVLAEASKGGSTTINTTVPASHHIAVNFNNGGAVKKNDTELAAGDSIEVSRHQDAASLWPTLRLSCIQKSSRPQRMRTASLSLTACPRVPTSSWPQKTAR